MLNILGKARELNNEAMRAICNTIIRVSSTQAALMPHPVSNAPGNCISGQKSRLRTLPDAGQPPHSDIRHLKLRDKTLSKLVPPTFGVANSFGPTSLLPFVHARSRLRHLMLLRRYEFMRDGSALMNGHPGPSQRTLAQCSSLKHR